MPDVIKNQELNQFEQLPSRGLVSMGSQHNITVCLDNENTDELYIGDFLTLDTTSKLKGLVVKKAEPTDKVLGIIPNNLKSDKFSNALKKSVFAISPAGVGAIIYAEAGAAIKRGDLLELDNTDLDKLHRVIKKDSNLKIGLALEEATAKGDLILISVK